MNKRNKEKERIAVVEKKNKIITRGIAEIAKNLEMMFMVDESDNTVEVDKKGNFTVFKGSETIEYNTGWASWPIYTTPEPIMTLRRYGSDRKKATLLLGFEPTKNGKDYLNTKYGTHLQKVGELETIVFSALERSINTGELAEVVMQMLEDFVEGGKKLKNGYLSRIKNGYSSMWGRQQGKSFAIDSVASLNPCHEIFTRDVQAHIRQASLQHRAYIAAGKTLGKNYAAQQLKKMAEKEEYERVAMLDNLLEESLTKNKNLYSPSKLSKPDIDVDMKDVKLRFADMHDFAESRLPKLFMHSDPARPIVFPNA